MNASDKLQEVAPDICAMLDVLAAQWAELAPKHQVAATLAIWSLSIFCANRLGVSKPEELLPLRWEP